MASQYNWSSYKEYVYGENIVNTKFILSLFGNNKENSIKQFIQFNKENENKYSDAEFEIERRMDDKDTEDCIKRILNIDDIQSIKKYNYQIRNEYICRIYKIKGISAIQIARLLDISKTSVYKILANEKNKVI